MEDFDGTVEGPDEGPEGRGRLDNSGGGLIMSLGRFDGASWLGCRTEIRP